MQNIAEAQKTEIWAKLKERFANYTTGEGEMSSGDLDKFIVDVLEESTRAERDYVLKNLFKVDVDNSGKVSFVELGNFLFKRHCGEMALQRTHRTGVLKHGSEYKLTLDEFTQLINQAYKFLGVGIPGDVSEQMFNSVDGDKDGLITYVEYFKVIEQYLCIDDKPKPIPDDSKNGPKRHSKLRQTIWDGLRRFYNAYTQGRSLLCNDKELRDLLLYIVPDLSEAEIQIIAQGLQKLNWKTIAFEPFAEKFIYLIAEVGLSRFSANRDACKRTLDVEEFILLLKNTFSFLKLGKFKNSILAKIFAKIDKNGDGLISFEDYLDWVKRFLAVEEYYGDEFYVPEDDNDIDPSDPFEVSPPPVPSNKFVFSDYAFARLVRQAVWNKLIPYDKDKNEEFSKDEIEAALVGLLKEKQEELLYVTKNVFRYDRNNDGEVTYHELTNFCTEQHFGEMAIQRRHRKGCYSQGAKRIMNKQEFWDTINEALAYVDLTATEDLIDSWLSVIDLDKDGWISYEVYFQFLKFYFGGASIAALDTIHIKPKGKEDDGKNTAALNEDQAFINKLKDLNPFERFSRIIIDQLNNIFFRYDVNKNKVFEADEVQEILSKVFELDGQELSYILMKYFSLDAETGGALTFEELIALILSIYFIEIVLKRKGIKGSKVNDLKISFDEFASIFGEHCFFIKIKVELKDLQYIFSELDTDKDGFITFKQYSDFIRKYLGNGLDLSSSKYKCELDGVSEEELRFVQAIWDELKRYFDNYDHGKKGYLAE